MIEIKSGTDNDAWNNFLEVEKRNQMITIAHNPSLGPILEKTFGYASQNLSILHENRLIGVFPTVRFKDRIISIPHFSYGGPVISNQENFDITIQSILGDKKFEIRSFSKLSEHFYDKKLSCVLELKASSEEHIMTLKSKLRQKIRKAEKNDFIVRHGGLELLDDYYLMYAQKMLQFGSPSIGKVFFRNLMEDYTFGKALITVVYDKNKVIAAGLSLSYLDFNEVCWSVTDSDYDGYNIHALICWELVKISISEKYRYFSFGRSTIDSNNHRFKKQWNPIEIPIFYNYSEPLGKSLKDLTYLTKVWKHQPLATSVYLGHMISKYLY
jgi:hypothetical protein